MSFRDKQEGGSHYKEMAIQPIDFIVENDIPFREGNVIKYVARHASKNGAEDLKKVIHYISMILETDYGIDASVEYRHQDSDAAQPAPFDTTSSTFSDIITYTTQNK